MVVGGLVVKVGIGKKVRGGVDGSVEDRRWAADTRWGTDLGDPVLHAVASSANTHGTTQCQAGRVVVISEAPRATARGRYFYSERSPQPVVEMAGGSSLTFSGPLRVVDEEVSRILDEQAKRASQTLGEHRAALDALASALATRESLDGAEVSRIVDDTEHPVRRLPAASA